MTVKKAQKAASSVKKGNNSTATKKVYLKPKFRRPKTLRLKRESKPVTSTNKMDSYRIVKYPISTEKATKLMEENNTLVFVVDPLASKKAIAHAVTELYGVKVYNINTLIRPSGDKKAYIRLTPETDALEIANTIGILQ